MLDTEKLMQAFFLGIEAGSEKDSYCISITVENAEEIVAFTKMHDREEIPDEMWEIVMALQDKLEEFY